MPRAIGRAGRGWAYHTILTVPASELGTHINVDFQLGRHEFQYLGFIVADLISWRPQPSQVFSSGIKLSS